MKEEQPKRQKKEITGGLIKKSITLLTLIKSTLTIHKVSELPEKLYLGKKDKLGFNIARFIKGTQIKQQVFPEPFIVAEENDLLQHYFKIPGVQMEKCGMTLSQKPLEYVSICDSNNIYLHTYLRTMKMKENYFIKIPAEGKKLTRCDDIQIGETYIYLVCVKEGTSAKVYNAHFYVLERKKQDKKLQLSIVKEEKFDNFIGTQNNVKDKIQLASIQIDSKVRRNVIYQSNFGLNKERTSTKIFVVDFDIEKKETKVLAKKDNVLKNEVLRGGLINSEWFYAQEKDKGSIFGCKISQTDIVCNQNTRFSFGDSAMSAWKGNFNYITKKTVVFLASEDDFKSCLVDKFPIEKDQMRCSQFKLDFSADQKVKLISDDMIYSRNLNNVIISYFQKNTNPLWISGYIAINIRQKSAQFTDLKQFQATSMGIVNATYYTLQMGKIVSLHKRAKRKFTITPPKTTKQVKIYLSAYKTYYVDNVIKKENQRIRGYVIKSLLNKVESANEQIDIYPIDKFTVYNDDSYQEFGYNSKQILGNNVRMEVSLAGHTFPTKKNFVKEIQLVGDKMNDKDVKELFLVGKGTFVYTLEGDKKNLKIMTCPVNLEDDKVTCKNYYHGEHENIKLIKATLFHSGLYVVVMKPKGTQAEMFLYRFVFNKEKKVYEFKFKHIQKIAEADSYCDIKMYGQLVFTICSNDGKEKGKPEIILNRFLFKDDGNVDVKEVKKINPAKLGNPNFKKGQIQFKAGSDQFAFTINNNKDDLTILKIDFNLVGAGLAMAISNKYSINDYLKMAKGEYNVQMCQTVSAIFLFEKGSNKIYGANIDYIGQSFLEVPINGDKRVIKELVCSPNREAFQVWVKDSVTEKKYLLSYYGFDGTLASKKLHSEYQIKQKTNHMATTSILDDVEGILHSYMYDESSMFYNQSLLIDLEGPKNFLKFQDVVKGRYDFLVKLKNEKKSKNFTIKVDVEEPEVLKFKSFSISKYPVKPQKLTSLKTYLNWTGPLFDFDFVEKDQQEWAKSLPRIRRVESGDIKLTEGKQEVLGITQGYYLMKDSSQKDPVVSVYTVKDKSEITNKIVLSKYGNSCKNFLFSKDEKYNQFFVTFVCLVELRNTVNIVKLIPKGQNHDLCKNNTRFEIEEVKAASDEKSIIVAAKEKGGDLIKIFKASKDENRPTVSTVSLNWRQPGDMSLFSGSYFDISNVAGVDILTVLSKGQNYVRAITLDFENGSILKITKIYGRKLSTYYFASCYDDDKKLQLICICGGLGIKFEQIHIDVDKDNKALKYKSFSEGKTPQEIAKIKEENGKKITQYRLPPMKLTRFAGGIHNDEYLSLYGEFGDYKLSFVNELGKVEVKKLNDVKIKRGNEKVDLIRPEIRNRLPQTMNMVLYKKGIPLVYSVMEADSKKFMSLDKEGKETYIYYFAKNDKNTLRKHIIKDFEIELKTEKANGEKKELKVQLIGFEISESKFYPSQANVRYFTLQKVSLMFVAVIVGMILLYTLFMLIFKKKETQKRIKRKEVGKELKPADDPVSNRGSLRNSLSEKLEVNEKDDSSSSSEDDDERETAEVKVLL